jgi:hypothetical protein
VLRCLCLGISCGFTTAQTFSLWQVEQAEVSGTSPKRNYENQIRTLSPKDFSMKKYIKILPRIRTHDPFNIGKYFDIGPPEPDT